MNLHVSRIPDPHGKLNDQLQSQSRAYVNIFTWGHTEVCWCRMELAYFTVKIWKSDWSEKCHCICFLSELQAPSNALGLNQTWATLMGDECSHHCTNSACLIHAHTDQFFFLDASDEKIRNLYCLLSHVCNFNSPRISLFDVWAMTEII